MANDNGGNKRERAEVTLKQREKAETMATRVELAVEEAKINSVPKAAERKNRKVSEL